MSDRITLTGLEVFAHHGVFDHEWEDGQVFVVDLVLEVDLSVPAGSDDLDDTVDYGALAASVRDRVAGERWNLIERVAERVADLVLEDPRVDRAVVTVHKPSAPMDVPVGDVSVTVARTSTG